MSSGPIVVGNIGSKLRMDYTAIGDDVNLAARLEGVNKLYKTHIIISRSTYELVADHFICRELDCLRVQGRKQPTQIYELLKLKDDHEKLLTLAEWVARADPSPREIREKIAEALEETRPNQDGKGSKYATCYLCGESVEKDVAEHIYLHKECFEKLDELKRKLKGES